MIYPFIHFSIAIDINPPSSSNVSGISWSILCREHIKTRKIRIGSWWKKLLKWTMIDILLIDLVICLYTAMNRVV